MAENTAIEWTDATFNPWTGCTKVSVAATGGGGCDHCYAEAWSKRAGAKVGKWGPGAPRVRTSAANWRQPLRWNSATFVQCAACGWRGELSAAGSTGACPACATVDRYTATRRRVFCASLADVFDNEVPPEWRADLFKLIADTPHLDWLLLTKRIGNVNRMLPFGWQDFGMPQNAWLGATIVNQAEADRDIPKLLATPARVRFLSMEPLLGPVNLGPWLSYCERLDKHSISRRQGGEHVVCDRHCGLSWVIVGGESGHGARPMHPDWARSLRDQCAAAGVPFLFKQWGEWAPALAGMWFSPLDGMPSFTPRAAGRDTLDFLGTGLGAVRIGKKAAGRLLDGVEHNGFPEVAHA